MAEYFEKTNPGLFYAYERRWMEQGVRATAEDPRMLADHFRPFPDWESMPGAGVGAFLFVKP